jgi:hypothetical protein
VLYVRSQSLASLGEIKTIFPDKERELVVHVAGPYRRPILSNADAPRSDARLITRERRGGRIDFRIRQHKGPHAATQVRTCCALTCSGVSGYSSANGDAWKRSGSVGIASRSMEASRVEGREPLPARTKRKRPVGGI